ncbi:MAG: PTS sugar transporter subunit IIC/EAL domain-containing protein [Paludibacterium sp.]|uniref:EAL domain-containing protein n=1 Tax=Paludibacterium sp. TaxID=1917523 RepID=UPI0025FA062F|nr:EAL domain-containing protein [Paludibacterium sp.]MBV8048694.1 PTS sugar transporter subunit IIC/EAL domain-containing protein [Paludibacterium sp.]MBV8646390.1 PTS sugar transporter subunit IIC/EAL domain-containing protein [Paludibacterium sp.]
MRKPNGSRMFSQMLRRSFLTLESLPLFTAMRSGLTFSLPLIMIGAFAILLRELPLSLAPAFSPSVQAVWRRGWASVVDGTFGIAALTVLIGYVQARTAMHNQRYRTRAVSPMIAIAVVLACFFLTAVNDGDGAWARMLSIDKGLPRVFVLAPLGSFLFFTFLRVVFPLHHLDFMGGDIRMREVLAATPAAVLTILCVALALGFLRGVDTGGLPGAGAYEHVVGWLDNSLSGALLYVAACQLLWFVGVHGPNLLIAIEAKVWVPATQANLAAIAAHHQPTWIFTKEFFDAFTRMGGSGSTLCLIVALLAAGRGRGARRFALFALIPALCNVNEPLLFGLPIIINPVYFIPFLLVPLAQTLMGYTAIVLGWVPHTAATIPWTTPALLSGVLTTRSWTGLGLQAMNLAVGTALYFPFVRLAARRRMKMGAALIRQLGVSAERFDQGEVPRTCRLPGDEGAMADMLANDLDHALVTATQLELVYQPQVAAPAYEVYGVEALLRWRHPLFGPISPPLTVALAEDRQWHERLGYYVLRTALAQRAAWRGQLPDDLMLAVNVTPKQLLSATFADGVLALLDEYGVPPHLLELEITESTMLIPSDAMLAMLQRLRDAGVRIALDDFGMGHTSLRYLYALPIDTIKIDRSLTQSAPSAINEHVIRSIVELGQGLNMDVMVEGVEDLPQLDRCVQLGGRRFQGYWFSPPLGTADCARFILANRSAATTPPSIRAE